MTYDTAAILRAAHAYAAQHARDHKVERLASGKTVAGALGYRRALVQGMKRAWKSAKLAVVIAAQQAAAQPVVAEAGVVTVAYAGSSVGPIAASVRALDYAIDLASAVQGMTYRGRMAQEVTATDLSVAIEQLLAARSAGTPAVLRFV